MANKHGSFLISFAEIILSVILLKCVFNYIIFSGHNLFNFSISNSIIIVAFYAYYNVFSQIVEYFQRQSNTQKDASKKTSGRKKSQIGMLRTTSNIAKAQDTNTLKRFKLKIRRRSVSLKRKKKAESVEKTTKFTQYNTPKKKKLNYSINDNSQKEQKKKKTSNPRSRRKESIQFWPRNTESYYWYILVVLMANTNNVLFQYYINFDEEIQPFSLEESNMLTPRLNSSLKKYLEKQTPSMFLTNPIYFYIQLIIFILMYWKVNFTKFKPRMKHIFFFCKASIAFYLGRLIVYILGNFIAAFYLFCIP